MKRLALIFLLLPVRLFAATCSSDGSQSSVQACVSGANNGDTITIPAGTFNWSTTVTVTKNVTIIGAGIDLTIINDNIPKVDPSPNVFKCTLTNGTLLMRISGLTINGPGGGTLYTGSQGAISMDCISSVPNVRIDNVKFQNLMDRPIVFFGGVMGVIDHCDFTLFTFNAGGIDVRHSQWKGVGNYGNNSWAQPSNWGSQEALFIEDCVFRNYSAATYLDGDAGMRVVIRKSTIFASEAGNHGTETGSNPGTPYRGGRTLEMYQNNIDGGPSGVIGGITNFRNWVVANRSGPMLLWGNTLDRYDRIMDMTLYRLWFPPAYWGYADGTNVWDVNHAGGPFATGTAAGANTCSGATCTVTVSGSPGWTTNQWVGNAGNPVTYILRNTTNGTSSAIKANTSNTISYASNTQGANMAFVAGNNFDIRAVEIVLDQPGRGQSDLISGVPPTPATWPHNALEPVRIWGNTLGPNWGNGNGISKVTAWPNMQSGVDYCQSDDNSCALVGYTPFTYPHPLVGGASPSPTPTPTPSVTPTPSPTPTPTPTPIPGTPTLVQHVASGMDRYAINTLVTDLPNLTLQGNCLIAGVQYTSVGSITSITDDKSNTWTLAQTVTNATTGTKISVFYALNVAADTKTVTVNFSGGPNRPQAVISEFTNIAQAGALDGNAGSSTSKTAGTITTTANSDLIWHYGVDLSDSNTNGGAFNGTSITSGSGFTLLNADLQVGVCTQYQVQSSAGAISPAFTTTGSATWGSIAIALKSAQQGTAPSPGIRIIHLQHTLLQAVRAQGRSTPIVMQFPSSGNLLVGTYNAAAPFVTGVTDNAGNTWSAPTNARIKDVGCGCTSAQIVWAANAATSPNLSGITVGITAVGTGDMYFMLYDITDASTSQPDTQSTSEGNQGSFGPQTTGTITPTQANELIIHVNSIDFSAEHTMTYPANGQSFFDTFTNDHGHGSDVSTLDMDNGYAHIYNQGFVQSFSFTFTACCAGIGIGPWAGVTVAFKPSTSATPTPAPSPTPTATPTPTPTPTPTASPVLPPQPPPRKRHRHH